MRRKSDVCDLYKVNPSMCQICMIESCPENPIYTNNMDYVRPRGHKVMKIMRKVRP